MLRPGGRLMVIGYYGRDDMAGLLEPEVVEHARQATQRRIGWWLRHGFKIKVVHTRVDLHDEAAAMELLPLPVRRPRPRLPDGPHPRQPRPQPGPLPPRQGLNRQSVYWRPEYRGFSAGIALQARIGASIIARSKARLFSPRSLAFGVSRSCARRVR